MTPKIFAAALPLLAVFAAATSELKPYDPEGERLARFRCAICHAFPEPGLLPKKIWEESVLPQMGYMMGIYPNDSIRRTVIETGLGGERVEAAGIFPEEPTIDLADWEKIRQYYLEKAPETLPAGDTFSVKSGLRQFRVEFPELRMAPPSTTLVKIRKGGGLYIGDANSKRLFWFDKNLKFERSAVLGEGVVALDEMPDGIHITIMGSFSPTDAPVGRVVRIAGAQGEILLDSLLRPVHASWADLDGDGLTDAVVCEYSKWTSALAWRKRLPNGLWEKRILRNRPGAIKAYVRDFNRDGAPDIIALFGQGDEGIFMYLNDGKGEFTEKKVLSFPPVYGSSAFRLLDFNADGFDDIVYTCGDNADYTPILKPYHGIRVFLNDGKNVFTQSLFIPLNGAYDAIPADYDGDGDLDIAAVSFFPNFGTRPYEAFLYLENDGKGGYQASSFPEVGQGRWMVMDAGDIDADGDTDLVLGPLTFEAVPDRGEIKRWLSFGRPFAVLRNVAVEK